MAIPKPRQRSYFPDWLLERRRRAEAALMSVVATRYPLGVSTRRMEKLAESLGLIRLSKSQVSVMAADLHTVVADFRTAGRRSLYVRGRGCAGAESPRRRPSRQRPRLLAVGVNADGHREILGLQVTSAEDGAGWLDSSAA